MPLNRREGKHTYGHTEKNGLIVGVEDPSKAKRGVFRTPQGSTSGDGLGHPSLAVQFDEKGKARIGGELKWSSVDKAWVMDNASSRYGRDRTKRDLKTARDLFERSAPAYSCDRCSQTTRETCRKGDRAAH